MQDMLEEPPSMHSLWPEIEKKGGTLTPSEENILSILWQIQMWRKRQWGIVFCCKDNFSSELITYLTPQKEETKWISFEGKHLCAKGDNHAKWWSSSYHSKLIGSSPNLHQNSVPRLFFQTGERGTPLMSRMGIYLYFLFRNVGQLGSSCYNNKKQKQGYRKSLWPKDTFSIVLH